MASAFGRTEIIWHWPLVAVIVLALISCSELGTNDSENEATKEVDMKIPSGPEAVLIAPGAVHHLDLDLDLGWFVNAIAFQEGIDVRVRLRRPDGSVAWEVDSPNGDQGPEALLEIVDNSGRYRIEVVAPPGDGETGAYRFELQDPRPATADDRALVAADHAYHDGRRRAKAKDTTGAIAALQGSLAYWQEHEQLQREAETLEALGIVYEKRREFPLALGLIARAAELYRLTGADRRQAVARDRAGLLHLRLGQTTRAVGELQEALALYRRVAYPRGEALALSRLATAFRQRGEIRRSLHAFDQALALISTSAPRSRANILSDTGALLLRLNQPDEARRRYEEALALFRGAEDLRGIALVLTGLASSAVAVGDGRHGLDHAAEALTLFEGIDDPRQASALVSMGRIRHLAGEPDLARAAYENAITISGNAEAHGTSAAAHLGLGYLLYDGGDSAAGLEHLERAQTLFEQAGDFLGVASANARCAEALLTLGQLDAARSRIETAIDTVEAVRDHADRRDHRIDYFASRQRYFEIAIDVAMAQHKVEPGAGHQLAAFELHERRLARELRDAIDRPKAHRVPAAEEPTAEERELESRLGALAAGAAGTPDQTAESTQKAIQNILEQLHSLWAARRTDSPSITLPPASAELIRQLLDAETLLIAFALGEKQSTVWAYSATGITAHQLPARPQIERAARIFSRNVLRPTRDRTAAQSAGRRLRDLVLGPIAEQLGNKRLVIVPDGALHAVPFAALPDPEDGHYLIHRHELVVLPSANLLVQLRRAEAARTSGAERIIAFADPVFATDDPRLDAEASAANDAGKPADKDGTRGDLERLGRQLGFDPYARLEHTHAEAQAVVEHVAADERRLITGFDANRETFLGLEPGAYRVLHLATHAVSSPEHAELSGLVLSLVNEHGQPRDGYVRAYEIARMDLPLELVNLSACQTGMGTEVAGEGMLGLARAFLTAGATRVIASLWNVSDRHTAALMRRFYDAYLNRGEAPAAALRSAQLELLADPETAAPYAWAGFLLHGDWRAPWADDAWSRELERMRAEDAGDRRRRGRRKGPPIEELEVPDEPTDEGAYIDLPDPDDPPPQSGGPAKARRRAIWERLAAARRQLEAEASDGPAPSLAKTKTPTGGEPRAADLTLTRDELGRWLEQRLLAGDLSDLDLRTAENASKQPPDGRELPRDIDPHDLAQAGWGVIYPRSQRRQVETRLEPLLTRRKQQAKDRFKLFPYDGESAAAFLADRGETSGTIRPQKVPYYLLIVGKPSEIPFDFHYQLNVNHAVGRLSFDNSADYRRYAEAVCRAERKPVPAAPTVGIFAVDNDGDEATRLLTRHLVEPLERNLRGYVPGYGLETWHREAATKEQLRQIYGGDQPPGLVLASCHGKRIDPEDPALKAYQGALMCQYGPAEADRRFAATDIPPDVNLGGQISFLFACYGAGTPLIDNFPQRPRIASQVPGRPALLTDRPFVARLPQALLARGAQAVVGHVDRGWTLSFAWSQVDEELTAVWSLEDTLKRLLMSDRLGHAMRPMYRRYTALAARLGRLFDRRRVGVPIDPAALAEAWVAHHDARNFIVLGDPAVYLRGRPAGRDMIRLDRQLASRLATHANNRGESVEQWAQRVLAASLAAEQEQG